MEVFERYAPSPPACVLDIGGGAGAYALPLARLGYLVHLVDVIPLHIEQARAAERQQPEHPLASSAVGDARRLSFEDGVADVVLLLGPLYHLTEEADRVLALAEAYRVLRPGGLVLAAAISRFASVCDGLRKGYLNEPAFESIVQRDLQEGQHRNPTERPEWFTTAYFHRPEEFASEIERAGFELVSQVGVEGPAWLLSSLSEWLGSEEGEAIVLRTLRRVESEPSLLGASAHLLAVGKR